MNLKEHWIKFVFSPLTLQATSQHNSILLGVQDIAEIIYVYMYADISMHIYVSDGLWLIYFLRFILKDTFNASQR